MHRKWLKWSAAGDSRQKDTGGFWHWGMKPIHCHQFFLSAHQWSRITLGCNVHRNRLSTAMAITDFLAASDITSAINACKGEEAGCEAFIFLDCASWCLRTIIILIRLSFICLLSAKDSFSPKIFFKTVGLSKKTPTEIERVFKILDQDKSGYIEQDELQLSFRQISYLLFFSHVSSLSSHRVAPFLVLHQTVPAELRQRSEAPDGSRDQSFPPGGRLRWRWKDWLGR